MLSLGNHIMGDGVAGSQEQKKNQKTVRPVSWAQEATEPLISVSLWNRHTQAIGDGGTPSIVTLHK